MAPAAERDHDSEDGVGRSIERTARPLAVALLVAALFGAALAALPAGVAAQDCATDGASDDGPTVATDCEGSTEGSYAESGTLAQVDAVDGNESAQECVTVAAGERCDVNGNGSVDNRDVGAFCQQFHLDAYERSEFDYNEDEQVTHGDVVALSDYVALR